MEQRRWPAVSVVAIAVFVLVTSEMLPVGLLTALAQELGVSVGVAGTTLTAPGLIAALAAPAIPIAAWRVDRRVLLAALMALLALGNATCALAPSFVVLFTARVIVGISIGGSWALAASVGGRLVTGAASARAMAIIFGGVSVATVVGVPAGAWIGDAYGWRAAFGVSAVAAALMAVSLATTLPSLPGSRASSASALGEAARTTRVRQGLLNTALIVMGHFVAYTFVGPLLRTCAGIPESELGALLLVYGVAGVAGNFVAGMLVTRDVRRVLQGVSWGLALAMFSLPWLATLPGGPALSMALWGLAYGAVGVSVQAWITQASPQAIEPATALSASVFNLSIATGAFAGGRVLDHFGTLRVLALGGALAWLAMFPLLERRTR